MRNFFLSMIVMVGMGAMSLFASDRAKFEDVATELSSQRVQALVVAAKALTTRADYNDEQKSLANYVVRIDNEDEGIAVSFIAIPRRGDEGTFGGNFSYARSVTYIVDERTFRVLKVVGSK